MSRKRAGLLRPLLMLAALVLAAIFTAPYISASGFRNRIRAALESALQRRVTIGAVHYSLFPGPGFTVEDVAIADEPSAGYEPFAYVAELKGNLRLSSLFTGHISFANLVLDEPTVNLVRPASGGWNIQNTVNRAVWAGAQPHEHEGATDIAVRSGRINFKFSDTKSVFYIRNADVDIYPNDSGALVIHFAGEPARTDNGAHGFGRITGQGMVRPAGAAGDQLTLGVRLERSSVEELCRLLGAGDLGVHGGLVANAHLTGSVAGPAITGDLTIDGLHRWDLLPSPGDAWTVNYRGKVDVRAQALDLETTSSEGQPSMATARLHASDLSSPKWSLSVIFNGFPAASLIRVARQVGAPLPRALAIDGTVTGAVGYARPGGLEGQFALSSSTITAPGASAVRADGAQFTIKSGAVSFGPADVQFDDGQAAQLSASYDETSGSLSTAIETRGLAVDRMKAAASALLPDEPIPLLDSVSGGLWRGSFSFSRAADTPGVWSGTGDLQNAAVQIPGLASPLRINAANISFHGPEVGVSRLRGTAGAVAFEGDYHFAGVSDAPDHIRLNVGSCDVTELQRLLAPTLDRSVGLLDRLHLRRATLPAWLKARNLSGAVQVRNLTAGDIPLGSLKAVIRWNGPSIALRNIAWTLAGATGAGSLVASLAGPAPAFTLAGNLRGLPWRDGALDLDGRMELQGDDLAALGTATGEGAFRGRDLTLAPDVSFEEISGAFRLASDDATPRLQLDRVQARTDQDSLTGQGASQPDGRIVLDLVAGGHRAVRYVAQGFGPATRP